MALFGRKKNKEKVEKSVKETSPAKSVSEADTEVILRPRISEKATGLTGQDVYVFEVSHRANKSDVAAAINSIYKVVPLKVNIIKIPRKQVYVRGKRGIKGGGKKAYVHLKEGEKIEIV